MRCWPVWRPPWGPGQARSSQSSRSRRPEKRGLPAGRPAANQRQQANLRQLPKAAATAAETGRLLPCQRPPQRHQRPAAGKGQGPRLLTWRHIPRRPPRTRRWRRRLRAPWLSWSSWLAAGSSWPMLRPLHQCSAAAAAAAAICAAHSVRCSRYCSRSARFCSKIRLSSTTRPAERCTYPLQRATSAGTRAAPCRRQLAPQQGPPGRHGCLEAGAAASPVQAHLRAGAPPARRPIGSQVPGAAAGRGRRRGRACWGRGRWRSGASGCRACTPSCSSRADWPLLQ